jgi:DnaJ-class molecular chaperone|tara:strand:+ start:109 stop:276 length:168 start_codon:yes stop_codon:yes gene_type:complete
MTTYIENCKDVTCPDCEGQGTFYYEVGCDGNDTRTQSEECETCEGNGTVMEVNNG